MLLSHLTEEKAMKALTALAAVLVAATSLLIITSPALATAPKNGRIVFRRYFTSAHNWVALHCQT